MHLHVHTCKHIRLRTLPSYREGCFVHKYSGIFQNISIGQKKKKLISSCISLHLKLCLQTHSKEFYYFSSCRSRLNELATAHGMGYLHQGVMHGSPRGQRSQRYVQDMSGMPPSIPQPHQPLPQVIFVPFFLP